MCNYFLPFCLNFREDSYTLGIAPVICFVILNPVVYSFFFLFSPFRSSLLYCLLYGRLVFKLNGGSGSLFLSDALALASEMSDSGSGIRDNLRGVYEPDVLPEYNIDPSVSAKDRRSSARPWRSPRFGSKPISCQKNLFSRPGHAHGQREPPPSEHGGHQPTPSDGSPEYYLEHKQARVAVHAAIFNLKGSLRNELQRDLAEHGPLRKV